MKHIFLNLKRFDIPQEYGGVNRNVPIQEFGRWVVTNTQEELKKCDASKVDFIDYLPEAHIIPAVQALSENSPVQIGCQSVFRADSSIGGNIGAFTSNHTANAMKACGCTSSLIGHCEERFDKKGILAEAGVTDSSAVNRILNQEVLCAQKAGLHVLFCIGETMEEKEEWKIVLASQLIDGLKDADLSKVTIGYEPVWSIGPGKTPADREYIQKIARFVKETIGDVDVVYGGGLKKTNSAMLASIPEISGGLIALTRFEGSVGFYPEEYLEIVQLYLSNL